MLSESGDRVQSGKGGSKAKIGAGTRLSRGNSGIARRRAARHNTKHIGNLAELAFMLQAATQGFPVAKPFGDNEHYDVLVDARQRLWRVQVKAATLYRDQTFAVRSHWSGKQTPDSVHPGRYRFPRSLRPPSPHLVPDSRPPNQRPTHPQPLPLRRSPLRREL